MTGPLTTIEAGAMESAAAFLKSRTTEAHKAAESRPFQRALLSGRITREAFAAYLGQMCLIHRSLEAALREARDRVPAIAGVVREYQYQEPYLLDDLRHLGVTPAMLEPLPATTGIVEMIEQAATARPMVLLGMHYVLEGSNNGSAYIARALRRSLGLAEGRGDRYLDPYGPLQRERWAEFKRDLDAVVFTETDREDLLGGALAMFEAVTRLSDELHHATGAGESSPAS